MNAAKPELRRMKPYLGRFAVYGPPHPIDGGDYAPLAVYSQEADALLSAVSPALLEALIQTRAALAELQNYIPMRYNRELQRLLARDQELIERAGGEV